MLYTLGPRTISSALKFGALLNFSAELEFVDTTKDDDEFNGGGVLGVTIIEDVTEDSGDEVDLTDREVVGDTDDDCCPTILAGVT